MDIFINGKLSNTKKVEMRKIMLFATISLGISLISCDDSSIKKDEKNTIVKKKKIAFEEAPVWSQNAVWYQIFVERFRNGDTNNDPTLGDIKTSYPKYPISFFFNFKFGSKLNF